jgi:hypothetical protein
MHLMRLASHPKPHLIPQSEASIEEVRAALPRPTARGRAEQPGRESELTQAASEADLRLRGVRVLALRDSDWAA